MQTEKEYYVAREISSVRSESTGEYSLPDYNGDVRKVLSVKPKLFPSGSFNSGDTLEFSGTVGYDIVYLDNENAVSHAEFSTDYEGALKVNEDSYIDSDIRTNVAGCNMRLVGPRKFSVRTLLDSDIKLKEKKIYAIDGDAFEDFEPETLEKTVNVFSLSLASGEENSFSDSICMIEGAILDEVEVLLSECNVRVSSVSDTGDGVQLDADADITVLYKNGDGEVNVAHRSVPLSQKIELSEYDSLDSLDPRFEVTELVCKTAALEDGVSITYSLKILPKVLTRRNENLTLICDAYLKERGTLNEYSDFLYTEHICTVRSEDRFETSVPISELGIDMIGDVIWSEASVRAERCEACDNCLKIGGEIRFCGIACHTDDDSDPIYFPVRFSVPFEQNVNYDCQNHANIQMNHHSAASGVKMYFDDNNVYASCDLRSVVSLSSKKNQRCLGLSNLTDAEYTRDESCISVYYPDPSETLFEIAKKYHTSVTSIAEVNRLSQSVFASGNETLSSSGINKLIIK